MVIASDSARAFGSDPPPVKEIAERLGVRYLLKGSVQTSGDRLRAMSQLLDAVAGRHLWSEVYDREVGDVFAIQDEISEQVLKQLQVRLTFESGGESRRTRDLDEYLTYLRWRHQSTQFTPEGNAEAFAIARRLLAEQPDSALAHEMMGMNHYVRTLVGSEDPVKDYAASREPYEKAIELDPEGANYQWLGWVDLRERRFEDAIRNADKGSPSFLTTRCGSAGAIKAMAGQPREGVQLMRRAVRTTPMGSEWVIFELAYFLMMLGDYEEAREISLGLLARDVPDVRAHHHALPHLAAISVWQTISMSPAPT